MVIDSPRVGATTKEQKAFASEGERQRSHRVGDRCRQDGRALRPARRSPASASIIAGRAAPPPAADPHRADAHRQVVQRMPGPHECHRGQRIRAVDRGGARRRRWARHSQERCRAGQPRAGSRSPTMSSSWLGASPRACPKRGKRSCCVLWRMRLRAGACAGCWAQTGNAALSAAKAVTPNKLSGADGPPPVDAVACASAARAGIVDAAWLSTCSGTSGCARCRCAACRGRKRRAPRAASCRFRRRRRCR